MTAYTAADASQPAIVRRALDAALVSGDPYATVKLGPIIAYVDTRGGGTWTVRVDKSIIPTAYARTTEQAVAAIVAARNERI